LLGYPKEQSNFFQQEPNTQLLQLPESPQQPQLHHQPQTQKQPEEQFVELTTQFLLTFSEDLSRGTFDSNETDKAKIGMSSLMYNGVVINQNNWLLIQCVS
jgi:hypothetical protein